MEPISEGLSEVGEASGVCKHLKKVKRKKKQSDREILKSADENKLDGTNDVASGSKEIVERVEAEEKAPTSLEEHEDKQEPLDHGNPLTQELMAKEADLHQLLESEVHLVESKGKEMSALLSAVDRLEDEKHDVDKKVAEIDAQMSELKISKDQLLKSTEDKDEQLVKLLKKKNKLEKFITEKVSEKKEAKSRLEKEIEEIKVRSKETERDGKSETQPETSLKMLVEYINDQIESKERELECPVCLALAYPPLFCCEDQHLICAECRPKVCTCLAHRLSLLTFCVRCQLVLSAGTPILPEEGDTAMLKKQPRSL